MISKVWLTFDALASSALGAVLFFAPHLVGDYVFQKVTDGVHWHLIRCVGGQFMAAGLASHLLKNSNKVTHTACYIMRIVAFLILILLYLETSSVNPNLVRPIVMVIIKYGCLSGLAINVLLLLATGWPIGNSLMLDQPVGNGLYQLDCTASICIGAAWLAFPKWLLHKQVIVTLDESHELCGRVMGALFVCSFCVAQYALHWPSYQDRKVGVRCRFVCCVAILSAQVWSQVAYLRDWSAGHWYGIALYSIWTTISFFYLLCVEYYTPKATDKQKKKN
ncbi:unnamed protein product, partial [Mesorhabditis spiculigera]